MRIFDIIKRYISPSLLGGVGVGLFVACCLAACTADENTPQDVQEESHCFTISSDVTPFEGEEGTRVKIDGTGFEAGDWIKLKIICPYSTNTELGESTYGNSFDGFWLMKYTSGTHPWTPLTTADGCDIDGDYSISAATDLSARQPAQATPYVFTASTWSEEISFFYTTSTEKNLILSYNNVFHADQTLARDYKASDVLWAQQFMQTGCWDVHLDFHHVMSSLLISVNVGTTGFSLENAVVTIDGMPDIDQQEIIVGDYYANASKVNATYGYKQKNNCTKENNGKVLGIGVNGSASRKAFSSIPNTATYTAHHVDADGAVFRVIVPPVTLATAPTIWIRSANGEKRYHFTYPNLTFEQGKQYKFNMNLTD